MIIALVLGVLAGVLLPTSLISSEIVAFIGKIFTSTILYLTPFFIIIKTYLGFLELKKHNNMLITTGIFLGFLIISSLISGFISICLMNMSIFQISAQTVVTQISDMPIEAQSLQGLLGLVLTDNMFNVFINSGNFILPFIFIGLLFGLGSYYADKKGLYFVETIESLDAVLSQIVRQVMEFFPIGAIFIIAYSIKTDLNNMMNTTLIYKTLASVIVIGLIIVLFYTLYLYILLKKDFYKFYLGFLGAGLMGFITGTPMSTVIPLNKHINKNLGVDPEIADSLTPLGVVFNKSGTIIVSAVSIMMILSIYSNSKPSFSFQMLILVFLMLSSLLLDGTGISGFLVLISMVLGIDSLKLEQNSYLLLIPSIPILSRIGILIDTLSTAIFVLTTAKIRNKIKTPRYIDTI